MNVCGVGQSFPMKETRKSLKTFTIKAKNVLQKQIASGVSQLRFPKCFSVVENMSKTEAFDEFLLSGKEIKNMREELKQTGLCKVKMSDSTKEYLNNLMSSDNFVPYYFNNERQIVSKDKIGEDVPLNDDLVFENLNLKNEKFVEKVTLFCKKILRQKDLIVNDAIIRNWEKNKGSCYWHQDAGTLYATLILTLKGEETEYVSPNVSHKFALASDAKRFIPLEGENIDNDIREMDKDYFHLFLTPAYKGFPSLIHRSPRNDNGRTILAFNFK